MCLGPELAAVATTAGEAASAASPYLLAASAGSQLAGSYAQSRAARAQNDAQQQAMETERAKQHSLQAEANQAVLGTADKFKAAVQNPQLEAAGAARTAAQAPAPIPTQGYQTTTASAPQVVESDQERKLAEALSAGKQSAKRGGALQAYGDSAQTNQIALGRAGQQVGQLANFSHGTSNTLPFSLRSAYGKGANWGETGDVLDALGRVGTMYGLARKKPTGIGYGAADPANASVYDAFGNLSPAI